MKKRLKSYLKLNLISLFFIAVSFISVTLAWFAYSGVVRGSVDIPVKAWYIQMEKDGHKVSNDIVITLDEIYPGMDTVYETLRIQNLGDSDANLHYEIMSARILGDSENDYPITNLEDSLYVEDLLSHYFPFNINMSVSKHHVTSGGDEASFDVSVSWPLDSDDDEWDSEWGNKAYEFLRLERLNEIQRPSIHIVISVVAEQDIGNNVSSDARFALGKMILFNPVTNQRCTIIGSGCISTNVIDINNTLGDETVTLLPTPMGVYPTGTYSGIVTNYDTLFESAISSWTVDARALKIEDIMKIIALDVKNSILVRDNLSDAIIGSIKTSEQLERELIKVTEYKGYYKFENDDRFGFLSSSGCYWFDDIFEEDEDIPSKAFALEEIDEFNAMIYGRGVNSSCKVIPVIIADKSDLNIP